MATSTIDWCPVYVLDHFKNLITSCLVYSLSIPQISRQSMSYSANKHTNTYRHIQTRVKNYPRKSVEVETNITSGQSNLT